ncbi:MAG: type II toxin-antitoxin system PemK/MazF family toxin [Acidobacteria bacterium]|nr:type II toxin-antitoxin system PemK/MazF family toxin [Acidobacteriota bacterium]MYH31165.1 type II toxin-antitoxin system PemK/MazF family toxin [Acidobacteriota bacterium]MYK88498.1 type II toxin-antitoxin system PemK/MazF family toxin [Acidobacteriota bacterium]
MARGQARSGHRAGRGQGDIRWANLNPARGHEQGSKRPVVVLSHDIFNERRIGPASEEKPAAVVDGLVEIRRLSLPRRLRPARFSARPLPRGPSLRTAGRPVPA